MGPSLPLLQEYNKKPNLPHSFSSCFGPNSGKAHFSFVSSPILFLLFSKFPPLSRIDFSPQFGLVLAQIPMAYFVNNPSLLIEILAQSRVTTCHSYLYDMITSNSWFISLITPLRVFKNYTLVWSFTYLHFEP